jgi:enoyl-CoA hydratase/carnithine racemase
MADGKPGAFEEMGPDFQLGLLYLMAVRKPIICAINGPCAGLGFVMAMLCDIRFASTEAKFTTAFANRGLIAEHGISWILPRLVGPAHALDLLWSGRLVDATEAASMGVVNRVVAADDLLREATGYVETLAERSAPLAIQVIKQQVYRHLSAALGDATRESLRLMKESQARADFAEGVKSFVEKRPPQFARVPTC